MDPLSNKPIRINQVERINPDRVYDLIGVGFTYHQKGLSREQVVDKVFEEKAALALKEILKKEDPGIVELPRVVQDKAGKDVGEWEAIFKSSDGCIIFLEAKFRMSMVSILSMFNEHLILNYIRNTFTDSLNACRRAFRLWERKVAQSYSLLHTSGTVTNHAFLLPVTKGME